MDDRFCNQEKCTAREIEIKPNAGIIDKILVKRR
jgi:hypothetical protein